MSILKKYQEFLIEREPKNTPEKAAGYWQNYRLWHRYKANERQAVYINVLVACLVVGPLFVWALMYTALHPEDTAVVGALVLFAVIVGPLIILGLIVYSIINLLRRSRHE